MPQHQILSFILFLFCLGTHFGSSRVVFLGASITYGAVRDGKQLQKFLKEKLGLETEIFSEAVGGWTSTRLAANIGGFVKKYPADTHYFIHIGGNDVSVRRPYPGGAGKLRKNLVKILETISNRGASASLSRLSFRAYRGSKEEDGSLPYNLEVYDQLCKQYTPDWYNPQERRCSLDFYGWARKNKQLLAGDGVHFSPKGYRAIREKFLVSNLFIPLFARGEESQRVPERPKDENPGFEELGQSHPPSRAIEIKSEDPPANQAHSHSNAALSFEELLSTKKTGLSFDKLLSKNSVDSAKENPISVLYVEQNWDVLERLFETARQFLWLYRHKEKPSQDYTNRLVHWQKRLLSLGLMESDVQKVYAPIHFRLYHRLRTYLLQSYLLKLGISPGPLDGIVGSKTRGAWMKYLQKRDSESTPLRVRYGIIRDLRAELIESQK